MEACERLVMPGDDVTSDTEDKAGVVLGPGLRREAGDQVRVTKPGVMRMRWVNEKKCFWVDVHSKRYVANRGENVIGVVLAKMGDTFRVDIGTAEPASLSYLAFEAATKRNRPNVNVGDLVYAKLLVASSHTKQDDGQAGGQNIRRLNHQVSLLSSPCLFSSIYNISYYRMQL